jgi:hypothetical protein
MVRAITMRREEKGAAYMSRAIDEARIMTEKYLILAETTDSNDRERFTRLAAWWRERAAEIESAERVETHQPLKPGA